MNVISSLVVADAIREDVDHYSEAVLGWARRATQVYPYTHSSMQETARGVYPDHSQAVDMGWGHW